VSLPDVKRVSKSPQVKKLQLTRSANGTDVIRTALDAFGLADANVDDYALFQVHGEHHGIILSPVYLKIFALSTLKLFKNLQNTAVESC